MGITSGPGIGETSGRTDCHWGHVGGMTLEKDDFGDELFKLVKKPTKWMTVDLDIIYGYKLCYLVSCYVVHLD